MEDALSLEDALAAAIRYRMVRTSTGVCAELGTEQDHLFDIEQVLLRVRQALERGDVVSIDATS